MKNFITNFAHQLLDQEVDNISSETVFRDLEDWDSLTAMAVLAMIEDEYGVKISDGDFKKLNTIQDLYSFVFTNK
jgi:acyl carrier protein